MTENTFLSKKSQYQKDYDLGLADAIFDHEPCVNLNLLLAFFQVKYAYTDFLVAGRALARQNSIPQAETSQTLG